MMNDLDAAGICRLQVVFQPCMTEISQEGHQTIFGVRSSPATSPSPRAQRIGEKPGPTAREETTVYRLVMALYVIQIFRR